MEVRNNHEGKKLQFPTQILCEVVKLLEKQVYRMEHNFKRGKINLIIYIWTHKLNLEINMQFMNTTIKSPIYLAKVCTKVGSYLWFQLLVISIVFINFKIHFRSCDGHCAFHCKSWRHQHCRCANIHWSYNKERLRESPYKIFALNRLTLIVTIELSVFRQKFSVFHKVITGCLASLRS